jgi:apolipoprotein N-acyltransferase
MIRKADSSYPAGLAALMCACSGLCVSFCFWPYRTGFLAYVVVIPFVVFSGIRDGRGKVVLNSFVFGMSYFMGSLYWIAMLEREQITVPWLRLPAAIVLCLYLSLFMMLTGYLARRLAMLRVPYEIALALSWGAMEYLRSLGPLGFPWASLGYSQTPYPPVTQQAAVIGTYCLSAWIVFLNGLLARFVVSRYKPALVLAALVFAIPVVSGWVVLSRALTGDEVDLSLIQPDISGSVKWDQTYRDSTMQLLVDMTVQSRGADMIVWPETAVPFYLKATPNMFEMVAGLARGTASHILVGFPDYESEPGEMRFYNSAMLLDRQGNVAGQYRKIHLVPFGEMIPFEDRISLLKRINLGEGDFSPGDEYTIFGVGESKFAVGICFECIYPDLVGEFVKNGAGFIVNITNDEWFGPSLGPNQHAQMAVMRAVEFRVGLARCANTGISMFVDPYGRITSRTRLFERQTLRGGVVVGAGGTPYVRAGRFIENGMLLVTLLLAALSWVVRAGRQLL